MAAGSYSIGLSLWSGATALVIDRWEARELFFVFFIAAAIATVVMTLLCPREVHREEPDEPIRVRLLLMAACPALGLMLFDSQIAALFLALGFTEVDAAWSGLAMGIGALIAGWAVWLSRRHAGLAMEPSQHGRSDRVLLFGGAFILLLAFVLGGVAAGLSLVIPVVALWLLFAARVVEEVGTTLASTLVPALARGAAYMAAVQIARALGKFLGGYAGGAVLDGYGFDAGHPARNVPAVLTVMALGVVVSVIGIPLARRELRRTHRRPHSEPNLLPREGSL